MLIFPDAPRFIPATLDLLRGWFGPVQCGPQGYNGILVGVTGGTTGDYVAVVASPQTRTVQEKRIETLSLDPLRSEVHDHLARVFRLPTWMRDGADLESWWSAGLVACTAAGSVPRDYFFHGWPDYGSSAGKLCEERNGVAGGRLWAQLPSTYQFSHVMLGYTQVDARRYDDMTTARSGLESAALKYGGALWLDADTMILPWPGGPRTWRRTWTT